TLQACDVLHRRLQILAQRRDELVYRCAPDEPMTSAVMGHNSNCLASRVTPLPADRSGAGEGSDGGLLRFHVEAERHAPAGLVCRPEPSGILRRATNGITIRTEDVEGSDTN